MGDTLGCWEGWRVAGGGVEEGEDTLVKRGWGRRGSLCGTFDQQKGGGRLLLVILGLGLKGGFWARSGFWGVSVVVGW